MSTPPVLALGIDLGGTSIKLALQDQSVYDKQCFLQSSPYQQPSAQALGAILRELVKCLMQQHPKASMVNLSSVSVAFAGPLDELGKPLAAANLPDLIGMDLPNWVREWLRLGESVPVRVITDTLAAAWGEYHHQPYPGRSLYLSIGTGVGGVVLDEDRPLLITRGTSGHLGQMDVSGGEEFAPLPPSGASGELEAYFSGRALEQLGVPVGQPGWLEHPITNRGLRALARGLRIALAIYRPNRIVLMGGLGLQLQPALPTLDHLVRDRLTSVAPQDFILTLGQSGMFAAAIGAMQFASPFPK